ncbi:antitoxin [Streptomyces sp. NPDC127084]|uniref:antitoxin n=1 Tax=Streptomyces sp. NPDC127084 TaxID=3347133 RepID=UPI00364DA785
MGILDTLKTKLAPAKDKVSDFAHHHEDKIDKLEHGLEKAAAKVDHRTKGKYHDKITSGTGRAKEALDRLAHKEGHVDPKPPGTTPPPS